jgi:molybdopterin-guanine dinucleotide biosynthesis protein B
VISSPAKLALIEDTDHDLSLGELLGFFRGLDLVLAEGYKRENRPKVEVYRPEAHPEPLCRLDKNLIALVSDIPLALNVPRFGLEDAAGLAAFLKQYFHL